MEIEELQEFGLSKNEAKAYAALVELGSTSAGPLIKRLGMHRAAVYNLLDLLISKGLVSFVLIATRKQFRPEPPANLLLLVENEKERLTQKEYKLKKIIPQIEEKLKAKSEQQDGFVYKGKKGLKAIFEGMLSQGNELRAFGATGKFKETLGTYYNNFHNRRKKLEIPLKIIFSNEMERKIKGTEFKNSDVRFLKEPYDSPSTTYIYGTKVATIVWTGEPIAFLLKSSEAAKAYNSLFNSLWKNSTIRKKTGNHGEAR